MKIQKLLPAFLAASLILMPSFYSVAKNDSKKKTEKTSKSKKDSAKDEKKDDSDSTSTKKEKKSTYTKLVESFKNSAKGEFMSLHENDKDKIFIEMPVKYSGKRFLAGGEVKSVSDPSIINIGYKYDDPIYLQVVIQDSIVVLQKPTDNAFTFDPQMKLAMERNYIPETYKRLEVAAYNPDSTSIFFDATSIINSLVPETREFTPIKGDDKSKFFSGLKAFKDNASVNITQNVDMQLNFLGIKIPIGKGTMTSTVSFFLLPDAKMRPRLQDSRVGVFSTNNKWNISTAEDGYSSARFATRWRLEPVDTVAWESGKLTEVTKPIVWYVDNSFPEDWKKPIKEGILSWNAAFEKIGLKDVMQVRDFPTKEEDPEFDPDNLKYTCIRYIPNATMNAMGPSWIDPVTGEILNASVIVYNDVIKLVNNWRFILTAQVDERARNKKMPKDLMEESMVYVIAHEIGHTLGLMHNMGSSYAIPVDSLRSPSFTAKYGTTPSIMDYARFNYVAQPGDKNVKLVPPALGVYDIYAIDWLYRPVPQAKDMWEEAKIAGKLIDEKAGDPYYRYGAQQVPGYTGDYDPRARVEDLGDDPIKAGNYGVSNLKYILPNLNEWVKDDKDRSYRSSLYQQIVAQYHRYIGNTLSQVGGIYLDQVKDGTPGTPVSVVPKDKQKASLKWAIHELQNSAWIDCPEVTSRFDLHTPASNTIVSANASSLVKSVPNNVMLASTYNEKGGYTIKDYYKQLFSLVFHGGKLTPQEKTLQRAIVNSIAPAVAKANGKKLAEDEEVKVPEIPSFEINCYSLDSEKSFGEDKAPYQKVVRINAIDETDSYNLVMLRKIMRKANRARKFGPAADRAHYQYIYAKAASACK